MALAGGNLQYVVDASGATGTLLAVGCSHTEHGNVAAPLCQHCGQPGERFNDLHSVPCGRKVHRRCKPDHLADCDECHAGLAVVASGELGPSPYLLRAEAKAKGKKGKGQVESP